MLNEEKKNNPKALNGQTPYRSRTINMNGKVYKVNETLDSNGNTVYAGVTEKIFGIF